MSSAFDTTQVTQGGDLVLLKHRALDPAFLYTGILFAEETGRPRCHCHFPQLSPGSSASRPGRTVFGPRRSRVVPETLRKANGGTRREARGTLRRLQRAGVPEVNTNDAPPCCRQSSCSPSRSQRGWKGVGSDWRGLRGRARPLPTEASDRQRVAAARPLGGPER